MSCSPAPGWRRARREVSGLWFMEELLSDVVNNEAEHRFEITIDGHTGFLQYAQTGHRMNLLHTEVPPALGGRGLAGQLAKAALDHARDSHLHVIATCPFIKTYIQKHPEYESLVASS
jgi:predicted GNAT family acetyltransferase